MRRALRGQGVARAVVVTSRFHVLRTAAIFRVVFAGSGIEVRVVGAAGSPITMQLIRQGPAVRHPGERTRCPDRPRECVGGGRPTQP
jgi:hypothetical protein